MSEHKLCYVDGNTAYFTTCALDKQWGDDWDDVPYEYNAEPPYEWQPYLNLPPYEIVKIIFEGNFDTPNSGFNNSPYSVQDINSGKVAWLSTSKYAVFGPEKVNIFAGASIEDFCNLVWLAGGSIYRKVVPVE